MPNPTYNLMGRTAAIAAGGTLHPIGLPYLGYDDSDQSNPTLIDRAVSSQRYTWDLLVRAAFAAAVQVTTGLTVHVYAADYRIGTTRLSFPGGSIAVPAAGTCYLYLDGAGNLACAAGAFPNDVFRVAVVTADATKVTSLVDARWENFGIGGANAWYNVAAGADVNLNAKSLANLGALSFAAPTAAQISGGVLTLTACHQLVQSQTGTADDLDSITTAGTTNRLVILRAFGGHTITVKDSVGNIVLSDGDCEINEYDHLVLVEGSYFGVPTWFEVTRSRPTVPILFTSINIQEKLRTQRGGFTLVGGTTVFNRTYNTVSNEAAAASDDLDTVTGGSHGDLLILTPSTPGKTTTVKHSSSAHGFRLANQRDFVMDTVYHTLTCIHDGTQWVEVARSPAKTSATALTDHAIYMPVTFHIPGVPALGNDKRRIKLEHDCIIKRATIECATAPSGGALIVDVVIAGASMFTNQSEMPQIADGQTSGNSATKNHAYVAGQVILLEPEAVNTAADVTVTLHTYQRVQVPPS